jgi:hypothetical protein
MWMMIRNLYLKYEVDPLRNKEVTVKNDIFISSRGDISKNIDARVKNLVTQDVNDDKEHIFEV